ncbi:MAG TPA: tryptophan--tRNA ligase [Pseudonocardiaceae bacterium]|jgi:tryptophanyl-tRNA synthetase|nr:tryptophan--tRNA ligase [Pseudonocardiaceae bacterium]
MASPGKKRVLSGITATGRLHIGNYIGAISLWAEHQDQYENFLFVADLHALTIPEAIQGSNLRARVEEIFALYIACGIDPEQSTLFIQSEVPEHAELSWLMTCATPVSWLERSTQFKTKGKIADVDSGVGAGLLCYPCLQAADILLYDPDCVPVGADQQQHVEISRDIAQRFNALFGPTFKVPDLLIRKSGGRIMGLDNPTAKMSKSLAERQSGHAIALLDPPSQARKAILRAVTDSRPAVDFTEGLAPGVHNLLTILECLTGMTREQSQERFDGARYGTLKSVVADVVTERLIAIQGRYHEIVDDRAYLNKLLVQGADRAHTIAAAKLAQAYRACGLRS